MNSVMIVAVTRPPTMTTAKVLAVSDPMRVDSAAGISPSIAINAVISTGRSRATEPCKIASLSSIPSRLSLLIRETSDAVLHCNAE